jgi:undecaprenyl-diphosphatase
MDLMQAIVLGILQGLGEFLPISSSAHLILAPWLFRWHDPGLTFDVALHFGTLIALLLYFGRDWLEILSHAFGIELFSKQGARSPYPRDLLWLLVAATIPGALAGYFLEHQAETVFRNPLLIAITLAVMGFLLFLADKRLIARKNLRKITFSDAVIIGLAQAFAIIPGVSRSGSTITAGLFLGLDRVSAARFSFLMSTPIIFGACLLKAKVFFSAAVGTPEIVGILTAALSGYLAIAVLIRLIQEVSYKVFFWYRFALAVLVVVVWVIR